MVGYMLLRGAVVAKAALGTLPKTANDRDFYETKMGQMRWYFAVVIPKVHAYFTAHARVSGTLQDIVL